jgi:DNA-binding XRE family transcriptional regulator
MVSSSLGSPLIRLLGVSRLLRSAQIRMARAALNLTIRDLAKATVFHPNTITNIEVGRYAGNQDSIALIESVFREAGVEFLPQNGVRFHENHNTSQDR